MPFSRQSSRNGLVSFTSMGTSVNDKSYRSINVPVDNSWRVPEVMARYIDNLICKHAEESGDSVGSGLGNLVDYEGFRRAFGGLEFEPEFLLKHCKEGRVRGVSTFLGRPFYLEVKVPFEVSVVLDRTPARAAKCGCHIRHRHL